MKIRPRRNRASEVIRSFTRETLFSLDHLIYPLFVMDGKGIKDEITSLPGNYRWSTDTVIGEVSACMELGIRSFILFPKVDNALKDPEASYGYDESNFYLEAARQIKKRCPSCVLVSDVALDPYSSHGHDGLVIDGIIDNDKTLPLLSKMAVLQAQAGFDIIGPSDMMDGRVGMIRNALDREGWVHTGIMSYTAKYASAYYGPFRDALDSAPVEEESVPTDKRTYQMDPANKFEAFTEADLDVMEGADFLMVKPAIHYLDVIHLLKENYQMPIAAYHVSGECAMLSAACQNGWLDFQQAMPEALLSIKRAGADVIITYFAKDYAQLVSQ